MEASVVWSKWFLRALTRAYRLWPISAAASAQQCAKGPGGDTKTGAYRTPDSGLRLEPRLLMSKHGKKMRTHNNTDADSENDRDAGLEGAKEGDGEVIRHAVVCDAESSHFPKFLAREGY
ncbi:MAG: hypothetical protein Q9181_004871 [Wetmoreana brouardii]